MRDPHTGPPLGLVSWSISVVREVRPASGQNLCTSQKPTLASIRASHQQIARSGLAALPCLAKRSATRIGQRGTLAPLYPNEQTVPARRSSRSAGFLRLLHRRSPSSVEPDAKPKPWKCSIWGQEVPHLPMAVFGYQLSHVGRRPWACDRADSSQGPRTSGERHDADRA